MLHALVVDDSRPIRSMLRQILTGFGCQVAEAVNGQDALDHLRKGERPDFALVDWNMPVMTGLEFVRAVRTDPAFNGMRLMMVTTESEMNKVMAALENGADEYVMKPFTADVIREKLQLLGFAGSAS